VDSNTNTSTQNDNQNRPHRRGKPRGFLARIPRANFNNNSSHKNAESADAGFTVDHYDFHRARSELRKLKDAGPYEDTAKGVDADKRDVAKDPEKDVDRGYHTLRKDVDEDVDSTLPDTKIVPHKDDKDAAAFVRDAILFLTVNFPFVILYFTGYFLSVVCALCGFYRVF
jgi:hypothetical protein